VGTPGEFTGVTAETEILGRLEELENQMAFQDELHSQLSDVIARQDLELSRLKDQVGELANRLRDMGDLMPAGSSGQGDETPPHY
jgi:uncharacterized coiled-coil protein SlyX